MKREEFKQMKQKKEDKKKWVVSSVVAWVIVSWFVLIAIILVVLALSANKHQDNIEVSISSSSVENQMTEEITTFSTEEKEKIDSEVFMKMYPYAIDINDLFVYGDSAYFKPVVGNDLDWEIIIDLFEPDNLDEGSIRYSGKYYDSQSNYSPNHTTTTTINYLQFSLDFEFEAIPTKIITVDGKGQREVKVNTYVKMTGISKVTDTDEKLNVMSDLVYDTGAYLFYNSDGGVSLATYDFSSLYANPCYRCLSEFVLTRS